MCFTKNHVNICMNDIDRFKQAIIENNQSVLDKLILNGFDINMCNGIGIQSAIMNHQYEIILYLINNNVNLFPPDCNLLELAITISDIKIVKILVLYSFLNAL